MLCGGVQVTLKNLPAMLCRTAPKMFQLCSTKMPLQCCVDYQQNSFPAETVIILPDYLKTHSPSVPRSRLPDGLSNTTVHFVLTFRTIGAWSWLSIILQCRGMACKLLPATN